MSHIIGRGRYARETYDGLPGPAGPQGPQGPPGPQGPAGPSGPLPTIVLAGQDDGGTLTPGNPTHTIQSVDQYPLPAGSWLVIFKLRFNASRTSAGDVQVNVKVGWAANESTDQIVPLSVPVITVPSHYSVSIIRHIPITFPQAMASFLVTVTGAGLLAGDSIIVNNSLESFVAIDVDATTGLWGTA